MPTLETTERPMPRSALRHRPIAGSGAPPKIEAGVATAPPPLVRRASRLRHPESGTDVPEWKRADESAIPRTTTQPTTRRAPKLGRLRKIGMASRKAPVHPLLYLGLGMVMTVLLLALILAAITWVSTTLDDLHYGRPRTFQVDAYVGHNEERGRPSHFIALNLHGQIEIIELAGGDASRARIYLGPKLYGPGADLVPVTLTFSDVSGNHRPEMIVHVQGNQIVFLNDGSRFRPLTPGP